VSRRGFLAGAGSASAAGLTLPAFAAANQSLRGDPARQLPINTPLKVQPVFVTGRIPTRREKTSWRVWGDFMTEQDATSERERVQKELATMNSSKKVPLEMLPLAPVQTADQAAAMTKGEHDVLLVYPAVYGNARVLRALMPEGKWNLMFLRHRSSAYYGWHENIQANYLRRAGDDIVDKGLGVDDIVVDKPDEVLWRLRALFALKNVTGKKVLAIGGPWMNVEGGPNNGLALAKAQFGVEPITVPYADLGEKIKKARANDALVKRCEGLAAAYLKQKGTTMETSRDFLARSFLLTEVFRDLMDESKTDAIAINQCMGTIMGHADTTACIPVQLLSDEGYTVVCQGDFVATPGNMLLRYISGRPVFLNDPSYVHDGVMVLAHCTAPRKMDGQNVEPARIMTHYESDYGAAPKVEMKIGQVTTSVIPDFAMRKWMGVTADIVANPFYPICRSQIDVQVNGRWQRVNSEVQGWHWQTVYGDYLKEMGYAVQKKGIAWNTVV
jgi:hypothetical protein